MSIRDGYFVQTERFAGFWIRLVATVLDSIIVGAVFSLLNPLIYDRSYFDYGAEVSLGNSWQGLLLQAIYYIAMWYLFGATAGKMALRLRIVRVDTLGHLSFGQCVGRYFAQILSAIPFMLGFIWAAFDPRKQAWHDKLAGTLVLAGTSSYQGRPNTAFSQPR